MPCLRGLHSIILKLSQLQQPDDAVALARAIWRSLQLLPALQTSWTCGPFYSIMLHQVGAQCPHHFLHLLAVLGFGRSNKSVTVRCHDAAPSKVLKPVVTYNTNPACFPIVSVAVSKCPVYPAPYMIAQ